MCLGIVVKKQPVVCAKGLLGEGGKKTHRGFRTQPGGQVYRIFWWIGRRAVARQVSTKHRMVLSEKDTAGFQTARRVSLLNHLGGSEDKLLPGV